MFHFNCDNCDFSLDIDFVPREYVFDDGQTLGMIQRHIWCGKCKTITVAEALDEDSDSRTWRFKRREQHMRDLERGAFKHDFEPDLRRKWIADLEQYDCNLRKWQSIRSRAQHCLKCGNEQIDVPKTQWADIQHQTCGGTLRCTATIIAGTFIGPEPHKYTVDGDLIELGYRQGPFEGDKPIPLELWWQNNGT